MRRGKNFAKALARWITPNPEEFSVNIPNWIGAFKFAASYYLELLPFPVINLVTQTFATPAKWRYGPRSGAVTWRGTWNDLFRSGYWDLTQQSDWSRGAIFTFDLVIDDSLGTSHFAWEAAGSNYSPNWGPEYNPLEFFTYKRVDDPWIAIGCEAAFLPIFYADDRVSHDDQLNCRPDTWDDGA
jgi:hypothetical protein